MEAVFSKMFIDTHAHLTDARYESVRRVLDDAHSEGVRTVISVGYDMASSEKSVQIATEYDGVYAAVGVHPSDSAQVTDQTLVRLKELLSHPRVVALGEIGLDYHYEDTDKPVQKDAFIRQMEVASDCKMPIAIHSRDCTEDMLSILSAHRHLLSSGGIMHCFSGSKEFAKQCLDLGLHISFSGTVTFKNARKVQEAAAYVPEDRLLAETDSPYLSPEPFRGQLNSPRRVANVYRMLAALRGEDVEKLATIIKSNAYGLMPKLGK